MLENAEERHPGDWAVPQAVQKRLPMECAGVAGRRVRAAAYGLHEPGLPGGRVAGWPPTMGQGPGLLAGARYHGPAKGATDLPSGLVR